MRVLVTGGAGFVGSALVPELRRQGHEIVVLDWFLFPSDNPLQSSGDLTLIKGDIRNPSDVRGAMQGVDAVIHLAAMSNDPSGDLDKELTRQVNLVATRGLLDIARDCGAKRFIYASSASVYGVCDAGKVVESLPANPQTIYAETKALSEEHVLAANSSSFTTVCARPATLNGYADRLRLDLTANIFTAQALTSGEIRVFGGSQYRPNLSLVDMVRFYLLLLDASAAEVGGQTFNVVEADYTVLQIAKLVQEVVDPAAYLILISSKDTRSYRLCGERAEAVLGFRVECTLGQSVTALAAVLRTWDRSRVQAPQYRNVEWLKAVGASWGVMA